MWINKCDQCSWGYNFNRYHVEKTSEKKSAKIRYWKEGWIDEIVEKICNREIEISDNTKKIVKTSNKFLVEYAIEHVRGKK